MAIKRFRIAFTSFGATQICQNSTEEQLQCSADSKRSNVGAGYISLSENLVKFNEICCLPDSINLTIIGDESGMANTLVKNKAKFNKSSFLKFNSTKLKRAQKRRLLSNDVVEDVCPVKRKHTHL